MQRRQVRFLGRVQGVGFRATARATAAGFAVSGWVRNEADGSVLMQVQGTGGAIDAFLGAFRARFAGHIAAEHTAVLRVVESETRFDIQR